MRAFVTGASGHVGGNLVRHLLSEGYQVRALVRNDVRALHDLDIDMVEGNLCDKESLAPLMKDVDVVFHVAAYVAVEKSDVALMEQVNIEGTRAVCEAAIASGVDRLIHFSSVHAFRQRPTNESLTEQRELAAPDCRTPYDRTKAEAQRVVMKACERGLNASILHPTGIIGPHDYKPSRMGAVLGSIANGKMRISLSSGFDWVDVRDVCIAAERCVTSGKKGTNYLVSGHWASFKQLSREISKVTGKPGIRLNLPLLFGYLALPFAFVNSKVTGRRPSFSQGSLHAIRVQCKDIDSSLARNTFGHNARPLSNTIEDTIRWMQSEYDL